MFRQRLQVRFRKEGPLRFVGHRDLMRTFERLLRRSRVPLRMTEGFNPHPRMSFPLALAVGVEALEEVMEFELCEWVAPEKVFEQLNAQMPNGMAVLSVKTVDPQKTARVTGVTYDVFVPQELAEGVKEKAEQIDLADEFVITRQRKGKTKQIDIRPCIDRLSFKDGVLKVAINLTQERTVSPADLQSVFDLPPTVRMTRTSVTLADETANNE